MQEHPATVAAIERWRYAQELADRLVHGDLSGTAEMRPDAGDESDEGDEAGED